MKCQSCLNENATRIKIVYTEQGRIEVCDKCGSLVANAVPDVYCPNGGYFDENLSDAKHPHGQYVESKRHKAQILQSLGLREAGRDINKRLGKPMPYIADPIKRSKFMRDNFGE